MDVTSERARFALSLVFVAAACVVPSESVDERITVRLDGVVDLEGRAGADLEVEQALARAFERGRVFELSKEGKASVTVTYREVAPPEGRDLLLHVAVQDLPGRVSSALGEPGLDATVLLERTDDAPLAGDVFLATTRAARVVDAKADLTLHGKEAAERLVVDVDPELVLLALEWARDRIGAQEDLALADRVVPLLAHDDERVRLTAIETLGAIGGPAHVEALLRNLRLADAGHAYRTYEALAQLGGPEAEQFLGFAARNEEEPERRLAAQHALDRATAPEEEPSFRPVRRGHRK